MTDKIVGSTNGKYITIHDFICISLNASDKIPLGISGQCNAIIHEAGQKLGGTGLRKKFVDKW